MSSFGIVIKQKRFLGSIIFILICFRRGYQGHDDRGFDQPSRIRDRLGPKQVGFVDGVRGGAIQKRSRGGVQSRALTHLGLLPEEDLDLDGETRSDQAGRGRPVYGIRSWRGMKRGGSFNRNIVGKPVPGLLTWHKITLRNGAKYDKLYLLKELLQKSAVKFIPICYQASSNNSSFFVEDPAAARAVKVGSN